MDDPRELLREARGVCEYWTPDETLCPPEHVDTLNRWYALRDRIDAYLAAPQPEPVAWLISWDGTGDGRIRVPVLGKPHMNCLPSNATREPLYAAPPAPAADARDAEEWLLARFGVVRGHPEWRALMEAFNAGRDAALRAEEGKR